MKYLDDPLLVPLEDDDYVAFGLACCFVMNDNLKLDGKRPLPAVRLFLFAACIARSHCLALAAATLCLVELEAWRTFKFGGHEVKILTLRASAAAHRRGNEPTNIRG